MKHYRARIVLGWPPKEGAHGQYFVQYRWPLGRWKSRFEQTPTARDEELLTKEAAESLARALQARSIFWTSAGVFLAWIALEVGLWWYGFQWAPWTTLAALLLGWLWMLEDWCYRESTRLEAAAGPIAPPASDAQPPVEEGAAQDEPVQQALDEVFRSTRVRENGFFRELLHADAGRPPIIRSGSAELPATPSLEYGFNSAVISTGAPSPSGLALPVSLPASFTWTQGLTGSSQGRGGAGGGGAAGVSAGTLSQRRRRKTRQGRHRVETTRHSH
jgi:hypothetical protein